MLTSLMAALGRAMIAMDTTDFGNFLVHPLIQPPNKLEFLSENVTIDPADGTVSFDARLYNDVWRCRLVRGAKGKPRAIVTVAPPDNLLNSDETKALALTLGKDVSQYFNEIVFELDGVFFNLRDMMVTDKGTSPSVMLNLGIKVVKFPTRNLAF